jgi:hypothetical protein
MTVEERTTVDAPPDNVPIVLVAHMTAKHGGFPGYAWDAPTHAESLRRLHLRHRTQHEGLRTEPPGPARIDHDHKGDDLWAFGSKYALPTTWTKQCTGLAAIWCPIHGDCICHIPSHLELGDAWLESSNPACPLHGHTSDHPRNSNA